MAGRFEDKVAVITGASSGIGRATAQAFAREGARVLVADLDPQGGEETVLAISQAGGAASFYRANVAQAEDNRGLVEHAVQRFGRLDVLVLNAGILHPMVPLADVEEEAFDRTLAVNLKGAYLGMRAGIKQLLAQGGGGSIVVTASIAGLVGYPSLAGYSASKHGMIGLVRTAALDYAQAGIRVNAVAPGGVQTAMVATQPPELLAQSAQAHPLGRIAQPEEIAAAILYLASEEAGFVTGSVLTIDGGYTAR